MTTQDPTTGQTPTPDPGTPAPQAPRPSADASASNPTTPAAGDKVAQPQRPPAHAPKDAPLPQGSLPWLFDPQTGRPLSGESPQPRGAKAAQTAGNESEEDNRPRRAPVRTAASHASQVLRGDANARTAGRAGKPDGAEEPAAPRRPRSDGRRGTTGQGRTPTYAQKRVGVPLWAIVVALVVAIALVVTVVVLSVRSCTASQQQPVTPAAEQQWVSPYDWSNLRQLDSGFFAYYDKDGSLASEAGVDVSEHDGEIDWQAVKAAGADFAMIRLGYRGYSQGTLSLDDYFLANIKGAADAGLKVGVYFFSQAISADEAREEAKYVIDTLAGLGVTLAYPVAFDQEPITNGDVARTDNITNEQLTANALAFCQAVEQAGYQAMIYGNQHDLARLDLSGELGAYPLWYAEYEAAGNVPTGEFDFTMWQYTASGTVSGIPTTAGQVDMNIRFLG